MDPYNRTARMAAADSGDLVISAEPLYVERERNEDRSNVLNSYYKGYQKLMEGMQHDEFE